MTKLRRRQPPVAIFGPESILRRALVLLVALPTWALAALIGLSFLAPYLPLADSVAHFRLHLSLALIAACLTLALLRARLVAGIALGVATAGLIGLGPAWPRWSATAETSATSGISVMQLNLSYRNGVTERVVALIRERRPDFVALQEVSRRTEPVLDALRHDYPHRVQCDFVAVGGVAVLSRHPLADGRNSGCAGRDALAWLRASVDGRAVSVASLHLHWPYPFQQHQHITRIRQPLEAIPKPVIVGGDFNAAPWSHAVDRIARATETGVTGGLRFTYSGQFTRWGLPLALPIDHILHPDALSSRNVGLGPDVGSDHRPVIAEFDWN